MLLLLLFANSESNSDKLTCNEEIICPWISNSLSIEPSKPTYTSNESDKKQFADHQVHLPMVVGFSLNKQDIFPL